MKQSGLKGVHNPSEMFLEERSTNVPGSTIVATMEGTRSTNRSSGLSDAYNI